MVNMTSKKKKKTTENLLDLKVIGENGGISELTTVLSVLQLKLINGTLA